MTSEPDAAGPEVEPGEKLQKEQDKRETKSDTIRQVPIAIIIA
jgi:hypothetical protein